MATLRIPDSLRPGISLLRTVDRPTGEAIASALRTASSPKPRELANWLAEQVPSLAESNTLKLADTIVGLYSRLETTDDTVDEFAEIVRDAAVRAAPADAQPSEFETKLLEENLRQILNVPSFAGLVKSWTLEYENERDYCSARILTDLRPVFSRDVSAGPVAMLLQHHLKLSYHEGTQDLKYFYVTLDDEELGDLRRVLDRAEGKARSLKAVLEQALQTTSTKDHE